MDQDKIIIKVDRSGAGKRLDIFLAEAHPQFGSRSYVKRLIDEGAVMVNEAVSKPHHKLKDGDVVTVNPSVEKEKGAAAENIPLEIIYEDDYLLVVNKPAGMAAHPSPGIDSGTLVNALLYHCEKLSTSGEKERPGIVHRLDKDTSGLMVVAKDDDAHRQLARQFKERTVNKKYTAFVKGVMELNEGTVEVPIGRHPSQRQKQAVRFAESRDAVTFYRVIKRFKDATMIELVPKTGRMHQLRVHMAHIGHPILGDAVYGEKSKLISRQALHAAEISFTHPVNKKRLELSSVLPPDMQRLLEIL